MPSSTVIQNPITNVTAKGPWRTSLAVGVAYGTDLRTAQRVLLEATEDIAGVLRAPGDDQT